MTQMLSLPYYDHQSGDPLSPAIVQTRMTHYHKAFAETYYTRALVQLPWTLESLVGSRWAHIDTGEQVCIRDVRYQSGKCYPLFDTHFPGPLSSIGEWRESFIILQWVRIDTASVEASLPWYLFLQDFLWSCLGILSCEPNNAMTVLQTMALEHQCSQVQRVIDHCETITGLCRIKSTR